MTLATHPGVDLTKPIDLVVDDGWHGLVRIVRILPLDQVAPGATTIPVTLHAEPLAGMRPGEKTKAGWFRADFGGSAEDVARRAAGDTPQPPRRLLDDVVAEYHANLDARRAVQPTPVLFKEGPAGSPPAKAEPQSAQVGSNSGVINLPPLYVYANPPAKAEPQSTQTGSGDNQADAAAGDSATHDAALEAGEAVKPTLGLFVGPTPGSVPAVAKPPLAPDIPLRLPTPGILPVLTEAAGAVVGAGAAFLVTLFYTNSDDHETVGQSVKDHPELGGELTRSKQELRGRVTLRATGPDGKAGVEIGTFDMDGNHNLRQGQYGPVLAGWNRMVSA